MAEKEIPIRYRRGVKMSGEYIYLPVSCGKHRRLFVWFKSGVTISILNMARFVLDQFHKDGRLYKLRKDYINVFDYE